MMKFIEDKLEALDVYFSQKKESEKWLIILGIAGVISYIAFDFLLPYAQQQYKKSEVEKNAIERSINENTVYLNSITVNGDRDYRVKELDRKIALKKNRIEKTREKIVFIDRNLNKLSDMLFNLTNWSTFLDSITHKAETQNVSLKYVTNKFVDNNGSFGHVLEVGIGCEGSYRGIVKFMNELEQSVLVTDIYQTEMQMDENTSKIYADINISVWGINH